MCLRNLNTEAIMYSICPIVGLTENSGVVWLDFGLEVLKRVVYEKTGIDIETIWSTLEEIRSSAALLETNLTTARLQKASLL